MSDPVVSFIIPSYNYARYLGQAVQSVLDQTFADFELIVIDDCSTDGSGEVLRGFDDHRIRIIQNERNLGFCRSFNRAYKAARGRFIANLDADDWIAPEKTRRQLDLIQSNEGTNVVGTWVKLVDENGNGHSNPEIATAWNQEIDLNLVESWCVKNPLCRSSTLVDRTVHELCGLFEEGMVGAPDYEVWTRALRYGMRFDVVQAGLTSYRVHRDSVTHADPFGTFLEISYLVSKNILPAIHARALLPLIDTSLQWHIRHPVFQALSPGQRYRLAAVLVEAMEFRNYPEFKNWLLDRKPNLRAELIGKNVLALSYFSAAAVELAHVTRAANEVMAARDWWKDQADRWRERCERDVPLIEAARDWWKDHSDRWREKYERDVSSGKDHAGRVAGKPNA